ncbi:hypothetical protein MMC30_001838 [Trapelia coarctata]|nr:hypothetical protein [Trapelia coarctata]
MAAANLSQPSEPSFLGLRLRVVKDRTHDFDHEHLAVQRREVDKIINKAKFQKGIVFVAGLGFLVDAYDIFAVNTILPMLGYVYWDKNNKINPSYQAWMLCATLGGSIIGQVVFGYLGDTYGRKKMYGLVLVIILWATLGLAIAADGSHGSMNIIVWLVLWRFVMGVGVGGDYPLSAVLTSENAPKQHRSQMLAWVFFMQPIGQFLATVLATVIIYASRDRIHNNQTCLGEDEECFRAIDSAWRWIIGIGGVPALIALLIRLTIPESPRYTMAVLKDPGTAIEDAEDFFSIDDDDPVMKDDATTGENATESDWLEGTPLPQWRTETASTDFSPAGPAPGGGGFLSPVPAASQPADGSVDLILPALNSFSAPKSSPKDFSAMDVKDVPPTPREAPPGERDTPDPTVRRLWWKSLRLLLGPNFADYLREQRNGTHLFGTMFSWFLLDFAFFGLGMSSPKVVRNIWEAPAPKSPDMKGVYDSLFDNAWRSMIVVSSGAILGSVAMIFLIRRWRPWTIQIVMFTVLGALFLIIGGAFGNMLRDQQHHWALIPLYILCQFFFNMGPNATTFIIPAEQFRTEYRCRCHGLSAASGKLGSVVVQIFLTYVKFYDSQQGGYASWDDPGSTWLGKVLIVFGVLMLLGSVVTFYFVPYSRDEEDRILSLEDIENGKGWTRSFRSVLRSMFSRKRSRSNKHWD